MKNNNAANRHKKMVCDDNRTQPLMNAVKKCVQKNSTVIDIGTGTGILAAEAARSGAKAVLAVDCDADALDCARSLAQKEKLEEIIQFEEALSFELETEEKFDLIICETVGSFAFDENILLTLKDAKERFLRPGGTIIPASLELWGATLDSLPEIQEPADTAEVPKEALASKPTLISRVDFSSDFDVEIRTVANFVIERKCEVQAIALWPKVIWCEGEDTDASPLRAKTHWSQGIMPLEPRQFDKNEIGSVEIIIGPHPESPLLNTERLWRWKP